MCERLIVSKSEDNVLAKSSAMLWGRVAEPIPEMIGNSVNFKDDGVVIN